MADTTSRAKEPTSDAAAAPAWRDVYILAGMRGLSFAGDIAAATALTLLLQSNGAGSYAVMAMLLAAVLPPVLLAPVTGAFADRFDSKNLIVTVASLQVFICLAMTQTTSPVLLIALAALLSTGLAFTHPVFAGMPAAMVGKANIPRASSISQTTAMTGMVVAPGIAGFLTAHYGVNVSLVLDAATFVVVALGGLAIRTRTHKKGSGDKGAAKGSAPSDEPSYRVTSDPFLRSVLVLSGVVMAAASIINVLIVFYVRDTFGASEETYGLIMSSWMAGLVPGALLVRRIKRFSHETILIGAFLCITVGILGAGLAPGPWWIVPFYLLGGFGNGAQATVTHIVINLRVPDSHRGRAFAALGAVSNSGPAAGYLLGGVILGFMEPRYAFLTAGTCALLAVLTFFRGVLRNADSAEPQGTDTDKSEAAAEAAPVAAPVAASEETRAAADAQADAQADAHADADAGADAKTALSKAASR